MNDFFKKNIKEGEIFPFKSRNTYYLYVRASNSIFEINSKLGENLAEGFKNDVDPNYVKKIKDQIINEEEKSNLIINDFTGSNLNESHIIKDIFEEYNTRNFIFLRLEINVKNLKVLDTYAKCFNMYERLHIICLADKTHTSLISKLNNSIDEIKAFSNIRISIEYFMELSTIEPIIKGENIKISKEYLSSVNSKENLRSFFNQLKFSKQFISIVGLLRRDYFIKDSVIKTYPRTNNPSNLLEKSEEIKCNKCWAKRLCYSRSLYSFFSIDPQNCSEKEKNCILIRNIILSKFVFYQENVNLELSKKFKTKKLSSKNYKIIHINP